MIDKDGNKIQSAYEALDPVFALKEILFLMRPFRLNRNDTDALSLGKRMVSYLKVCRQPDPSAADLLEELEDYAGRTKSTDFLWELVYARRQLAKMADGPGPGCLIAAEHCRVSALHFESIVRFAPTAFNRCAEVIELYLAALYYKDAKARDKADMCLELAHEKFLLIEESPLNVYYQAGELLYYGLTDLYSKTEALLQEKLKWNLKQIYFSCNRYGLEPNQLSLQMAVNAYEEIYLNPDFPHEEEKPRIHQLLTWIRTGVDAGEPGYKSLHQRLERVLKLHEALEEASE